MIPNLQQSKSCVSGLHERISHLSYGEENKSSNPLIITGSIWEVGRAYLGSLNVM